MAPHTRSCPSDPRRPIALAIAIVVAGCGPAATVSPPTPQPTPAATQPAGTPSAAPDLTFAVLDACAILTQKDAETIAKTPLETGQPGNPVDPSCLYAGPVTGPLAQVQIFIGDGAKKTYDIDVTLKHVFIDLPAIGDEAHQEDNAIFFRKGTTWVAIELVRLNTPSENVKVLQDAAKKVVAALP